MKKILFILSFLISSVSLDAQNYNDYGGTDVTTVAGDFKITYSLYAFTPEGSDYDIIAKDGCRWQLNYVYDYRNEIGTAYIGLYDPAGTLVGQFTYRNKEMLKLTKNGYHCLLIGDGYSICFQAFEYPEGWVLDFNSIIL